MKKKSSNISYGADTIKRTIKLRKLQGAVLDESGYSVGYINKGKYYTGGPKEVENSPLHKALLERQIEVRTRKGPLKVKTKSTPTYIFKKGVNRGRIT